MIASLHDDGQELLHHKSLNIASMNDRSTGPRALMNLGAILSLPGAPFGFMLFIATDNSAKLKAWQLSSATEGAFSMRRIGFLRRDYFGMSSLLISAYLCINALTFVLLDVKHFPLCTSVSFRMLLALLPLRAFILVQILFGSLL